jgi:5-methyltetrahydrofolate--homocysteine methyltransferase
MDAVAAWRVFNGQDLRAEAYIAANANRSNAPSGTGPTSHAANQRALTAPANAHAGSDSQDATPQDRIRAAVLQGRGEPVASGVAELLSAGVQPLELVNEVLIPALDEVGALFEKGTFFLPQLMASAEAAKAGFNTVRDATATDDVQSKGAVAICTVKGDIHDIGKNIVKMLLENYGYEVHDVGRDVEPQAFVDEVVRHRIKLAGLSALMTTTVPAMADTIALLRDQAPWCKVMVGGAVLNPEYARMVDADFYARDASEAARIAAEVLG